MGAPCHRRVPGQPVSKGLEVGGQLAALQNRSFLPSCGFVSCAGDARLALCWCAGPHTSSPVSAASAALPHPHPDAAPRSLSCRRTSPSLRPSG